MDPDNQVWNSLRTGYVWIKNRNGKDMIGLQIKRNKDYKLLEEWNDNGILIEKSMYKRIKESCNNCKSGIKICLQCDKLHGTQEKWNDNGSLVSVTNYKNGKMDGLHEIVTKFGKETVYYRNDKKNGPLRVYLGDDKTPTVEQMFKDDKFHGTCREWHENGKLSEESHYYEDKPTGTWKRWNDEGVWEYMETYDDNGEQIDEKWNEELDTYKELCDDFEDSCQT